MGGEGPPLQAKKRLPSLLARPFELSLAHLAHFKHRRTKMLLGEGWQTPMLTMQWIYYCPKPPRSTLRKKQVSVAWLS
jgi:hypothetical protein